MNALRTVAATRYVTPLREGGSVPALVEADDDGIYVVKWRGAAQGPKALVAELVGAEVARALGLPVPEPVLVDVDPVLGRAEPDPELQAPLKASGGLNFGLDYLPGAHRLRSGAGRAAVGAGVARSCGSTRSSPTSIARRAIRTSSCGTRQLYLIDHGAALYFQHDWEAFVAKADSRFPQIRDHVLLPFADGLDGGRRAAGARGSTRRAWARSWRRFPRRGSAATGRRRRRAARTASSCRGGWRRHAPSSRRRRMPARSSFDYAVVRVVPRVERGERINAGVILYCRDARLSRRAHRARCRARCVRSTPASTSTRSRGRWR